MFERIEREYREAIYAARRRRVYLLLSTIATISLVYIAFFK